MKKVANRVKIQLEYPLRSSTSILYQYVSTPSGLQTWFSDLVEVRGAFFTFKWDDGTEAKTELVKNIANKTVRFQIINGVDPEEYLEFQIVQDDITSDVELMITEFVNEGDEESSAMVWDAAVEQLKSIIGA